jgi:GntR family phosphonate transport system transcriptional regulator
MGRTAIWQSISARLTADIAEGRHRKGDRLPTEAQLAARFGVNRHTVRRALSQMADQGLVHARRGSGVFVAATPTDYPIGRRVRFHRNIRASGQTPGRKLLSLTTQAAAEREARALDLAPGAPVVVSDGLSMADDLPVALSCAMFPADRLPGIEAALRDTASVTEALARCGVPDYTRASTRITALAATATQALHLRLAEGAPILRTESVNVDAQGRPVEYGRTWFAGDRVTLTLQDD